MPDGPKTEPTGKMPEPGRGCLANWHDMPDWMTEGDYIELGGGVIGGAPPASVWKRIRQAARRGRKKPR